MYEEENFGGRWSLRVVSTAMHLVVAGTELLLPSKSHAMRRNRSDRGRLINGDEDSPTTWRIGNLISVYLY